METLPAYGWTRRPICAAIAAIVLLCLGARVAEALPASKIHCEAGSTLASGDPDPTIFAEVASAGIQAFWCERYDGRGITLRSGPYSEIYPNGRLRTRATYVDSRLKGPVTVRNEDGSLFLRGFIESGEWAGRLEIFHPSGATWFEANFDSGRLEGVLRTRFPDGALESETRYQAGREDGLARSFYPTAAGGRLKSEARVEADQIVGQHRLLDRKGELERSIDWSAGPAAWRRPRANPAAPLPARAPVPGPSDRKRELRD